jgi:FSR family fosmidomycin resistance protein-like MFS transporter
MLTLGHFCTDVQQGAIPAMLPFLISAYGFSYAQATFLVLCNGIVSSVVQPLFGYLGDKVEKPWLMCVGTVLAGLGVALIGQFSDYRIMIACCMLTGVGVALFHPEGGRMAKGVAGARKGEGMSNFGIGGTLGFSGGALLVTVFLSAFGLHGTLVFLVPGLLAAIVLGSQMKAFGRLTAHVKKVEAASNAPKEPDNWKEFWKASWVNTLRSIIFSAFQSFIPLYWVYQFAFSESTGSAVLMVVSLIGAVATFFGGRIADRIGFKRDIVICTAVLFCGLVAFLFCGMHSLSILAGAAITICMLFLNGAYAPVIAMSQSCLPNHVGTASGVALGLSVSIGSICSPLLGTVGDADVFGLHLNAVFIILAVVTVLVFVSALFLKDDKKK